MRYINLHLHYITLHLHYINTHSFVLGNCIFGVLLKANNNITILKLTVTVAAPERQDSQVISRSVRS